MGDPTIQNLKEAVSEISETGSKCKIERFLIQQNMLILYWIEEERIKLQMV